MCISNDHFNWNDKSFCNISMWSVITAMHVGKLMKSFVNLTKILIYEASPNLEILQVYKTYHQNLSTKIVGAFTTMFSPK